MDADKHSATGLPNNGALYRGAIIFGITEHYFLFFSVYAA